MDVDFRRSRSNNERNYHNIYCLGEPFKSNTYLKSFEILRETRLFLPTVYPSRKDKTENKIGNEKEKKKRKEHEKEIKKKSAALFCDFQGPQQLDLGL